MRNGDIARNLLGCHEGYAIQSKSIYILFTTSTTYNNNELHSFILHAAITSPAQSVQDGTIAAVKRLLYSVRQCEKTMPSNSFAMMRKALYSVRYHHLKE